MYSLALAMGGSEDPKKDKKVDEHKNRRKKLKL
jgi:hypothetical protein